MTFWQDARPAGPRFRMLRRWRRSGRGRRPAVARRVRVAVIAFLVVGVAIVAVRAGNDSGAGARAADARSPRRAAHAAASGSGVVPARWSRSLPDWPQSLVRAGRDTIVIGGGWVSAIALDDGAVRWQTAVPRLDDRAAVRGDTVLVATESAFVALDRTSGARRWMVRSPEPPGPVALVGPDPAMQLAVGATERGGLVGIDIERGRARWSVRYSGSVRSPLAVDQPTGLVASVWRAGPKSTVLRVVDGVTGALRWEQPLAPMAGAPAIAGGSVVVSAGAESGSSALRSFALADGTPQWQTRVAAPSQPDLVPLVDGRDVVVVDQLGTVARVRIADGATRWSTTTAGLTTYAQPLRVGDAILIWNEAGDVITLDRGTGTIRARRRPAGVPVGLVGGGGRVVLAQRLLRGAPLQAFAAPRMTAPARSRR